MTRKYARTTVKLNEDSKEVVFTLLDGNRHSNFLIVFPEFANLLCRFSLSSNEVKVLFWILSNLDYENLFFRPQRLIAKSLGITCASVSLSFRRLVDLEIIMPVDKIGNTVKYMADPSLVCRAKPTVVRQLKERFEMLRKVAHSLEDSLDKSEDIG